MRIGKWLIVNKRTLEYIHSELWEARNITFWYLWGEEWLTPHETIIDISAKLNTALNTLNKILYGRCKTWANQTMKS
jgi:hypothetical protein